jgi:hypothetical protein
MKGHDRVGCVVAEAAWKGLTRPNLKISVAQRIEHVCHLHNTAKQKEMRPKLSWESTDEYGRPTWQLVEITCRWACVDHDGETLQKSYLEKIGKHDQLRREIAEAYPSKPVTQSTIVVSAKGAFMKKSLVESAKVAKLKGGNLERCGRNVVDAAMEQIEEHEIDCVVGEDEEEVGWFGTEGRVEIRPGTSAELQEIDDEVTGIEEWQPPCLAREPAIEQRRIPPP